MTILLALALAALTAVVFAPVRNFDFIELDDPLYVSENPHVAKGLTVEGLTWAFTTPYAGFWIPAVWVSYMVDVAAYGPGPSGHHITNLALHVLAAVLLFTWLASTTGAVGPSWVVAALFAVHPLRVESVGWITERKDVLSAVFWMLALWAYVRYVRRRGWSRYAVVAACFAAALMSKPMVITLPAVLLLVDVWPLGRVPHLLGGWTAWRPLLREKIPLFALSGIAGAITVLAHRQQGLVSLADLPVTARLANAIVVSIEYVGMVAWPARLAGVYPLGKGPAAWEVLGTLVLLGLASAAVLAAAPRRSFLQAGWFWFFVMLLPVIGLLQAGLQAKADRFTYLPSIGLLIAVVWGVADIVPKRPWTRVGLPAVALLVVAAYAAVTRGQLWYWQDSVAFWTRTWVVSMGVDEYSAHLDLGRTLRRQGRLSEAAEHFTRAARLRSDVTQPYIDLGLTHQSAGRDDLALAAYDSALRIQPADPDALNNSGVIFLRRGENGEAAVRFEAALRARPHFPLAHANLGLAYMKAGRMTDATLHLEAALQQDPSNVIARQWLPRLTKAPGASR